jgi:hypothetical protein
MRMVLMVVVDALDKRGEASVEDSVSRVFVCPCIILRFLFWSANVNVKESDSVKDDVVAFASEGGVVEVDDPRAAWFRCGRGLARSHAEKETDDDNLGDHRKGGVAESYRAGAR